MEILAWVIFIFGIAEILLAPVFVGQEHKHTAGMVVGNGIICALIATFAGIYLFS